MACAVMLSASAAGAGDRFYEGEARPASEVALVLVQANCALGSLERAGAPRQRLFARMRAELAPGSYTLCVGYVGVGGSETSKGCVDLVLVAQGGHVYLVVPEVGGGKWRPVAVDFGSAADYAARKDGEAIRKRAEKYFAGKREVVKLSKLGHWE